MALFASLPAMASLLSYRKKLVVCAVLLGGCPVPAVLAQDAASGGFSNYQNTPVNSILDSYEQFSGKRLIRDANLSGVPPITINETGLSKAEVLKLMEATLLLNGVALVPLDEHTVKVITVGGNKNPRSEGVKIYANAADLPVDEEIVSYYMPLNYISAQEAQSVFTQSVQPHPYGIYVIAPSAQAVVITENTGVIRQLIALKELIDVPPASVVTEFVQLNRADAEKVAELLNKLLNPVAGQPGSPTTPANATIVPASLGNNEPLSNERNLVSGSVQILPDNRSNRLLIITRPVNLPFLKQIIAQFDQPDSFTVPQSRALKYVLAQDILPALEAALAQGKDEEDQVKKDQSATPANAQAQAQNPVGSPTSAASVGEGGSGSVSAVTPQLQAPSQNNVPTVVSIGKTRILADNRSNSIIVFGSTDATDRVFAMVDQLDRRPLQVYLATVIGELTVSEGVEFGIDLLQKFQHNGSIGGATGIITPGTAASTAAIVPEPSSLLTSTGFPLLSGLTIYGAIGSTLNAYVRALETTNRFKVISRPSVYTTNNKLAVIASGSQVPVPSNTTSGFTGNNTLSTTSSITYENVLLQLDIIPLINASHQVTLKIRQTNNSLGTSQVISGNSVPTILTQEINTEVTVPDKSTIVIGGLISDSSRRNTSGVPFLSDIPLLGYLFKDTTKSKERDELIIMIQPTVVETDDDQISANETEKQRTILGRDAVEAAEGAPGATKTTVTTTISPTGKTQSVSKTVTTTSHGAVPIVAPTHPPGIVPILSSPAPDVSNGHLPKYVQPSPSPTDP